MKHRYVLLLVFLFMFLYSGSCVLFSQSLPLRSQPLLWFKADSIALKHGTAHDVRFPGSVLLLQSDSISYQSLHYHPAWKISSGYTANPVTHLPGEDLLTIYTVYEPMKSTRANIYSMKLDSVGYSHLTTTTFRNAHRDLVYEDSVILKPVINKSVFRRTGYPVDSSYCSLELLGNDSLPFHGKFAQLLYFDTVLSRADNEKVHTYLAFKYGISLIDMHYRCGDDSILWHHVNNKPFGHGIAGLGRDDTLGVYQRQSTANSGRSPLTVSLGTPKATHAANTSSIPPKTFLLWGHNGAPLSLEKSPACNSTFKNLTHRRWKMLTYGDSAAALPTTMVYRGEGIDSLHTIQLIISPDSNRFDTAHSIVIFPDSIDQHHNYYFSNVQWDYAASGVHYFAFRIDSIMTLFMNQSVTVSSPQLPEKNNDYTIDCRVYPNPSDGHFKVDYQAQKASEVTLSIYTMEGKQIMHWTESNTKRFSQTLHLNQRGSYMLKVRNPKYQKTYKLVVQ